MNTKFLRILNPFLGVLVVVQALAVSTMIFEVGGPYQHLFFTVHKINGLLLLAAIVVHVVMNRGWIKAVFLKKKAP